jgi:hypothetical protein
MDESIHKAKTDMNEKAAGICAITLITKGTSTNAAMAAAIAKSERSMDETNLFIWPSFITGKSGHQRWAWPGSE